MTVPSYTEEDVEPTAPESIYVAAGKAMAVVDTDEDEPELYEWHQCSDQPACNFPRGCPCAGLPYPSAVVRAAVDAAYVAGQRTLLAALSSAGRLVPPGSEVREDYGTRGGERLGQDLGDINYGSRDNAMLRVQREPARRLISRRVITTPWSPSVPDTKEET